MRFRILLCTVAFVAACATSRGPSQPPASSDIVDVTLLQLNDVYEIGAVEGGRAGGMARVATLVKRLRSENPNTYALLAGDFVSPSALGTAKVDGETLAGRQMVAALNAVGLDVATFGNHEFDIKEAQLRSRLAESKFRWTSANVTATAAPFDGVSTHEILEARSPAGRALRVGIIGVTLSGSPTWVKVADPLPAVRREVVALRERADVIVALTHLAFADDVALAEAVPEVDLVLGGHEHENVRVERGADFTPILKADANARTVYVHRLRYDLGTRRLDVTSDLVKLNDAIVEDPEVARVVESWIERGSAAFRELGFDPDAVVAQLTDALDGREASVRNRATNLTDLLGRSLLAEVPGAEVALYNSGSIRIDDELPPGPVTQYDVIRVLPFGGAVQEAEIQGDLLRRALDQGIQNRGSGGFLQSSGVERQGANWLWRGAPLDPARWYRVAINDYLAAGNETNLKFLQPGPEMRLLGSRRDVRMALIDQLRREYPVAVKQAA